jgi:hypothetical protein
MFVVSEAEADAIRAAFVQRGELSAAIELRRLCPGITDNVRALACARTIAGWKPLPTTKLRSVKPLRTGPPCPAPSSPRPTATSARRERRSRSCWRHSGDEAGNDSRPVEQPAAIVTAKKPRGRKAVWTDDGAETPESVKAFLARMVRPGGSLPPDAAE